jgi:urease accessory protein UreF
MSDRHGIISANSHVSIPNELVQAHLPKQLKEQVAETKAAYAAQMLEAKPQKMKQNELKEQRTEKPLMAERMARSRRDGTGRCYEKLMRATDYPYQDSTWPRSQEVLQEHFANLDRDKVELIASENVTRFQAPSAPSRLSVPATSG